MPTLFLLFVIPTANLMILAFLGYYLYQLRKEKKLLESKNNELSKKEMELDSDYHKIVDTTLGQERKIIDDATKEASTILSETKYLQDTYKKTVDQAIGEIIHNSEQKINSGSAEIVKEHSEYLKQMSQKSLTDLQTTYKQFFTDMQKQLQDFKQTVLPTMQKDIKSYKDLRFKEADKKINLIIREVSQKVLNKTISEEDHQILIIKSLEKFQKEGIFD